MAPVRRAYASVEPPDRYACGAPGARARWPNLRVVPPNELATTLVVLDLVGIFVFAISGALVAVRKDLDVFGVLVLAGVDRPRRRLPARRADRRDPAGRAGRLALPAGAGRRPGC